MSNTPPKVVVRTGGSIPPQNIIASKALEAEDEFRPYYADDAFGVGMSLIEPPYNPAILQSLCSENNTLGPCIDAMETNIDGTGFTIELDGETDPENEKIQDVLAFFKEVYPGVSFEQVRRSIRRDLEQTGNGYMEVMRNLNDEIVFVRHVAARTIRIMRLDAPIVVKKSLTRRGKTIEVPTLVRERRFAQMLGTTWLYFREFNSSRQVNCKTGWWDTPEIPVAIPDRGTEIIHFKVNDHYFTPYGLPRWEGQIPSVLGSRRAEEFNLDYFETGGLPPALITVSGGVMGAEAQQSLDTQFNSKARSKHRVAIMEVQSTGGSLDSAGKVDINVHSFGSERLKDALFQIYDEKCHDRTRRAFRLPPLFVGEIKAMNFAVAFVSYLIAENQVFRPERDEFDTVINTLIIPNIAGEGFKFRSKDLSVADISTKLAALQIAGATNYVDPKDMIKVINEVAGLNIKPLDHPLTPPPGPAALLPTINDKGTTETVKPKLTVNAGSVKPPGSVTKYDFDVLALADQTMVAMRERDVQLMSKLIRQADALTPDQQQKFKAALALRQYFDPSIASESMTDLAGCTTMALLRAGAIE